MQPDITVCGVDTVVKAQSTLPAYHVLIYPTLPPLDQQLLKFHHATRVPQLLDITLGVTSKLYSVVQPENIHSYDNHYNLLPCHLVHA